LQTAIDFNNAHADVEMPYFNQDLWLQCESLLPGPDDPQPAFNNMTYNEALEQDHLYGVNGIDAALSQFNLDAVVSATDNPAWATDLYYGDHFIYGTSSLAAAPGYPIIQVPAGEVLSTLPSGAPMPGGGAPMGISFFGTAFSEPTLIKLASGFEAVTHARAHNLPTFAQTVPNYNIQGTTLSGKQNITVPAASNSNAPASNVKPSAAAAKTPKPLHHL